jgi:membrane-bound lytic murein transglycosylase B
MITSPAMRFRDGWTVVVLALATVGVTAAAATTPVKGAAGATATKGAAGTPRATAAAATGGKVAAEPGRYATRADVRAFARDAARDTGIPVATIERTLAGARYQPAIVALMDKPLIAPPRWFEYAPPFLDPARVAAGVAFYDANAATLARAEALYGVPASIVVAIVGVETYWGRVTGRYRVLDALATLAFDYPRRAPFFRGELTEFLALTHEEGLAPSSAMGSYAGATGLPQFMPGSYRRYAIDFDGDGRIDLWTNAADTIGSVANFLARHDWARGQPVLLPASVDDAGRAALDARLDGGVSERRALDAWQREGLAVASLPADLAPDPVGVLALEDSADATSLWLACNNFYVITRYNRSRLYAAAVWNLAAAIDAARNDRAVPARTPDAVIPAKAATRP